jgi:hypothetical protein
LCDSSPYGDPTGGDPQNQRIVAKLPDKHVRQHIPRVGAVIEQPDMIPQFGDINYLNGGSSIHLLTCLFYTATGAIP